MKRLFFILSVFALGAVALNAQPIAVGETAPSFSLKNIDGSTVALSDYTNEKGVFVIFFFNACQYVKDYEERMIWLH